MAHVRTILDRVFDPDFYTPILESYDSLMKGTIFGTVIIPGDSKRSVLNKLTEGRAGDSMRMPHGDAKKLTAEEIELLNLWVSQGALNN